MPIRIFMAISPCVRERFYCMVPLMIVHLIDGTFELFRYFLPPAAAMAAEDARVDQVIVCTPDKDLAQCVRGDRVVQLDRRTKELRNESGVRQKFGVSPASIPDWLALVGDSADGFPGLPGWGTKSAATVLARYQRLEQIPRRAEQWDVPMRGTTRLATTLVEQWERALLFRR